MLVLLLFFNYFLPNKFLEQLLPGHFITYFSHLCHLTSVVITFQKHYNESQKENQIAYFIIIVKEIR